MLTRDPRDITVSVSGISMPLFQGHSGLGSNNTGIGPSNGPTLTWQGTFVDCPGKIIISLFVVLTLHSSLDFSD